jgi:mono/diheme cytochrome c family protein
VKVNRGIKDRSRGAFRSRLWPLCLCLTSAACGSSSEDQQAVDSEAEAIATIEHGRYLVEGVLQCFHCHSERDWDQPDGPPLEAKRGAGLVWRDDGTYRLVAPNLTPDDETGIGRWTDEQLARAIREGIGQDERVLSPAMWYNSFRHLSDEDVAAVIAYLRSLTPIRNPLPRTALAPEEQARIDASTRRPLEPATLSALTDPVERGRHLVRLADCAGCHTSWQSPRMPGILGGGNLISRGGIEAFSTNMTPHPSGVLYGADAFIQVMRTGKGGTLSPLMPWEAFRNLSDDDLRAIHAFLQTMHPVAHYVGNTGRSTYCEVCGQDHPLGELNHVERPVGVELDPRIYDDYAGTYHSVVYGFTVSVTREGDRLFAQWDDLPKAELIPQSETLFIEMGGIAPLRFVRDPAGRVTRVISEEVDEIVLERVQ